MIESILCGVIVGISLGLTGGGGSIFAVPLLLYVLRVPFREAVVVSLAVVGLTALYGALFQRRMVQWGAGAMLGMGGILGAPFGAWLGARLPEGLALLIFSGLMIFIGINMWRGSAAHEIPLSPFACRRSPDGGLHFHWACAGKLLTAGTITGVLSGVFGVGGGFLVVPALLLVTGMPMERALATSLVGIFLISMAALTANLISVTSVPGSLAVWFLLGSAAGMTVGVLLKSRLPSPVLKKVFAGAMIIVACWIAAQSLFNIRDDPIPSPSFSRGKPQTGRSQRSGCQEPPPRKQKDRS